MTGGYAIAQGMALVFAMGLQKRASLVVVFALGGILQAPLRRSRIPSPAKLFRRSTMGFLTARPKP